MQWMLYGIGYTLLINKCVYLKITHVKIIKLT